jgi:hypothetical protein
MTEPEVTDRIDLRNATPEFLYQWNMLRLTFRPVTYTPIYYAGNIAGSEFQTYNAKKLYFALQLSLDYVGDTAGPGSTQLFDETNNVYKLCGKVIPWWNGVAARYFQLEYNTTAVRFSKLDFGNYTRMIFTGYRLQLP